MKVKKFRAPTKLDLESDLEKMVYHKHELDDMFDTLDGVLAVKDGDLYDEVFKMFDSYVDMIAKRHTLDEDLLSWFIFDNECGENELEMEVREADGTLTDKRICHVQDFIEYLV